MAALLAWRQGMQMMCNPARPYSWQLVNIELGLPRGICMGLCICGPVRAQWTRPTSARPYELAAAALSSLCAEAGLTSVRPPTLIMLGDLLGLEAAAHHSSANIFEGTWLQGGQQ